jgi:hypothetical protein
MKGESPIKNKKNVALSYIRLLHASADTNFVDLYQENQLLFKNLCYQDFSRYIAIPSGNYSFFISLHKKKDPFYSRKLSILPNTIYTLVFAPKYKQEEPHLFLLEDVSKTASTSHCFLRMAHFSKPFSPLWVALDEKPFLKTFSYSQLSTYTSLPPQVYRFSFYEKNKLTIEDSPLHLARPLFAKWGRFYTLYFVGLGTKTYPCEVLVSIDGSSYLNCKKRR